jgi:hypothetical protein
MKNVGDGLAHPAMLARPEKNFQNLSDIGNCSENIFVDSNIKRTRQALSLHIFEFTLIEK